LASVAEVNAICDPTGRAQGDVLYASAANTLAWLAKGNDNDIFRMNGNVPNWEALPSDVEDDAFGSGWNGDTTHAPSQNAVWDKTPKRSFGVITQGIQNGASIVGMSGTNTYQGQGPYMPPNDADARVFWNIKVPDESVGTYSIKVVWLSYGAVTYSLLWDISSWAEGETASSDNILNGDNTHDLTTATAYLYNVDTIVSGDSTIAPGDILFIRGQSDANNARGIMFLDVYVEWTG